MTSEAAALTEQEIRAIEIDGLGDTDVHTAPLELVAVIESILAARLADSRRQLAAEIVSDGPKHPYNPDETVRINAWCAGLHFAAAIVRGEHP